MCIRDRAPSVLNGLVDKKIFEIYYHEIGRLDKQEKEIVELNPLNEFQQDVYKRQALTFTPTPVMPMNKGIEPMGEGVRVKTAITFICEKYFHNRCV